MTKRPSYKARQGREDRHGEMTGAIQVNMVFCALPVTAWCVFIGPWVAELWVVVTVGVTMAVVLPLALLPLSRRVWSYLSHWADTW